MNSKYLLLLAIVVGATGLLSPIIEPDGALYAYISKQMAQHNDFINLYNNVDWLDKPHFPFWITAISFKIFGINSFAYKLPAFLFWLMGIGYLYKLGKAIYNEQTATVAVLIYATALQAVIALFDVRAEHYLTALTIAAIYYLSQLYTTEKLKYVVLAAFFSACAVMTKGIFFLTTIVGGLGILILIRKEWKQFLNYRWYLYLFLTLVFIIPELYCLYVQFDLHPEKIVYDKTGVSGLRFFFWDSQFGRFFNTGPIKGKGDLSFFFHTTLWAFLPWSILLYTSVIRLIREKGVIYKPTQWMVIGSAGITFLIFSLSKFQLPHYIIVLLPQFSLLCADYLVSKQNAKAIRSFMLVQRLLLLLSFIAVAALSIFYGLPDIGWIVLVSLIIIAIFFYVAKQVSLSSVVSLGIGFNTVVILFLNLCFYPSLLQYQSGMQAANWFNKTIHTPTLGLYKIENFSVKFYADSKMYPTNTLPDNVDNKPPAVYYFSYKKLADSLIQSGENIIELHSFPNFHISKLTASFLNKHKRASQLDSTVIFKLNHVKTNP